MDTGILRRLDPEPLALSVAAAIHTNISRPCGGLGPAGVAV